MDSESSFDTTCRDDAPAESVNSTVVDTTHNSNASSNPSCSAVLDEVSSVYRQQVMASSSALENKYQVIVKDINRKLKSERAQSKVLEEKLKTSESIVENTRRLERELKANATVLQAVKKELDHSTRALEKSIVSERQRDQDFKRVREECDELEKANFELERTVQAKTKALATMTGELHKHAADLEQAERDMREQERSYEIREKAMRADTQAQFTEMQEDMAILVGRMQEMSAIKQKYETTEKNYEISVQENKILVATVAELKDSLANELGKGEAMRENVVQLGRENVNFVEQIKALDSEKWTLKADLEKSQKSLKEVRVERLDLKKTFDKKEKVLEHMGRSLAKVENELKSMEKMYKTKLSENSGLKEEADKVKGLEEALDLKEREMKAMDSQIDTLERDLSSTNAKLEITEKSMSAEVGSLKEENAELSKRLKNVNNEHESTEVNVCELKIKIQQLTEEQITFQAARRQFENELAEQASRREQAEHNAKRLQRKQDFLQDELDQFKAQFDKERAKFEQATRDAINLQDQVASMRGQVDALTIQLHDAEHRNHKTLNKTDRMKEKVKAYQKNITDAHCEEIDQLHSTIEELRSKLTDKERAFQGAKESAESEKKPEKEKAKKRESHRLSELEQTIAEMKNHMRKLESENQTLETMLETKKRVRDVSPEPKRRSSKILKERPELSKVLEDETVISEAGEENKENKKPNRSKSSAKKPEAKKARVVLSEKKNDTTLAPRTTRTRKVNHNKTMF